MLIAPTESAQLKTLGESSPIPERFGADVFWLSKAGKVGVQRKECKDFVASSRDGRLARELVQMKQLDVGIVLVEGEWQWTTTGESLKVPGYTKHQYRGMLSSIASMGYWTIFTQSLTDTTEYISQLRTWLDKDAHGSMLSRPKPKNSWGVRESKDYRLWWWQSCDGIGPIQAAALDDYFGGTIPLQWTCIVEELMNVKGIGKARAKTLWAMFSG